MSENFFAKENLREPVQTSISGSNEDGSVKKPKTKEKKGMFSSFVSFFKK